MAYGSRMCFGGFCRPPLAPNTKSCPNEVIRRETFSEQDCNPGNPVLPVSKVNKNSLRSSGMVTAFSVSSQGCGGHDAFIFLRLDSFSKVEAGLPNLFGTAYSATSTTITTLHNLLG